MTSITFLTWRYSTINLLISLNITQNRWIWRGMFYYYNYFWNTLYIYYFDVWGSDKFILFFIFVSYVTIQSREWHAYKSTYCETAWNSEYSDRNIVFPLLSGQHDRFKSFGLYHKYLQLCLSRETDSKYESSNIIFPNVWLARNTSTVKSCVHDEYRFVNNCIGYNTKCLTRRHIWP